MVRDDTASRGKFFERSYLHVKRAPALVYRVLAGRADQMHIRVGINSAVLPEISYAVDYHQQYLAKNPDGYCELPTRNSWSGHPDWRCAVRQFPDVLRLFVMR